MSTSENNSERSGIDQPLLPRRQALALGAERAERLEQQVEAAILNLADSLPSGEQAKQLGATCRALNVELSTRVARLEERRDALVEEFVDVGRHADALWGTIELEPERPEHDRVRAEFEAQAARSQAALREMNEVNRELEALSGHPEHPNAGSSSTANCSSKRSPQDTNSAASARSDRADERAVEPAREPPGTGLEPF